MCVKDKEEFFSFKNDFIFLHDSKQILINFPLQENFFTDLKYTRGDKKTLDVKILKIENWKKEYENIAEKHLEELVNRIPFLVFIESPVTSYIFIKKNDEGKSECIKLKRKEGVNKISADQTYFTISLFADYCTMKPFQIRQKYPKTAEALASLQKHIHEKGTGFISHYSYKVMNKQQLFVLLIWYCKKMKKENFPEIFPKNLYDVLEPHFQKFHEVPVEKLIYVIGKRHINESVSEIDKKRNELLKSFLEGFSIHKPEFSRVTSEESDLIEAFDKICDQIRIKEIVFRFLMRSAEGVSVRDRTFNHSEARPYGRITRSLSV